MQMKKFINDPQNIVPELLEGLALAYPDKVRLVGSNLVARAVPKAKGKVGVVTLGGSGHEPGLSGFVGEGMLDYSVAGEIFAAPGAPRCLEAIRLAAARRRRRSVYRAEPCGRRAVRQHHHGDGPAREA